MKTLSRTKRIFRTAGVSGILSALKVKYVDKWIGNQHNWLYGRLVELHGNTVTLEGCTFSLDTPPIPTEVKSSFFIDGYERPEREAIQRFLDASLPVVEFGAALGVVSCLTNRRLLDPRRHVVVEANPALIPLLTKNRNLNRCGFDILHRAVAYGGGRISFYANTNYLVSSVQQGGTGKTVEVEAITLRSILDEQGYGRCSLICDIEGAEADLVLHESDVLRERVSTLILELHPIALGKNRARQLLEEIGAIGFSKVFTMLDTYVFQNQSL